MSTTIQVLLVTGIPFPHIGDHIAEHFNIPLGKTGNRYGGSIFHTQQKIGGMYMGRPRNKWVAFLLCFFLGYLGAHKFYEGKAGMGILYLFTVGLFGIGWFIDCISILCKANPYYVKY